jgi:hypothetical protein
MSASVVSAIASAATVFLLAFIARQAAKAFATVRQFRVEHHFLMQSAAMNTAEIKRIMKHLEMAETQQGG